MSSRVHAETSRLFVFALKKEWLKLTLWLIGASFYVLIGIVAFVEIYAAPAEREMMALAMQNPAMEALFGRAVGLDNYTVGAMYTHTMTIIGFVLFSLLSILLVVRNTRSEEEEGILELIQSLPVGRLAHTNSAILLLISTNALLAVISAGLLVTLGDASMTMEGALLTGSMYGTVGLIFGAITLVTSQLSSNSRGAMMIAFSILGLSYILRIVGDSSYSLISWFSPLGLLYNSEPFVNNYWGPVVLGLILSIILMFAALYLKHKRDLGAGILPDKVGKTDASSFMKTPFGFALQLVRTPLIVWTGAMILLSISYGSVIGDVEGMLEGNDIIEQMIAGDPSLSMADQFITMILGVLAIISSIPAVQILLRLRGEEKKNRLEKMMAGSRSRFTILGSFLAVSILTAIIMQVLVSIGFGGAAIIMNHDIALTDILVAGLAYVPAIFVLLGLSTVLIGWFPKFTSFIWVYIGLVFINLYFSGLFNIPDWVSSLSPFHHVPEIPLEEWSWIATSQLSGVSALLMIIGFAGYRKRDIE